jgi:6-phosphogluconate dehydrogenase
MKKEIGIIGLGKMGGNMARRLTEKGWHVVGTDRSAEVTQFLGAEGIDAAGGAEDLVSKMTGPRIIWLMLPAGAIIDDLLFGAGHLAEMLSAGDIVIDGGNSHFKDAKPRAQKLQEKGIHFLDVGTSGGPGGARNGACLMIGGERSAFEKINELFVDLALPGAVQFFDGHGAGHFVKMVHNGIEYGMMQAIAEGFNIMKKSDYDLDLLRVTDIYNRGSVIESRLIGWLKSGYDAHGVDLADVTGTVAHTGEGAWTVEAAKAMGLEAKIIEASLDFRKQSAAHPDYTGQVLSVLREQFGGHASR